MLANQISTPDSSIVHTVFSALTHCDCTLTFTVTVRLCALAPLFVSCHVKVTKKISTTLLFNRHQQARQFQFIHSIIQPSRGDRHIVRIVSEHTRTPTHFNVRNAPPSNHLCYCSKNTQLFAFTPFLHLLYSLLPIFRKIPLPNFSD